MVSALVASAYVVPVLFGLGIYLAVVRTPHRMEAAAVAWGIGWAAVNIVALLGNSFLSVSLDGTFFAAFTLVFGLSAGILLFLTRARLLRLLRLPSVPSELKRGLGLAAVVLILAFVVLVFYKGLTTPPASTDAIVYHMQLPRLAFESGDLEVRAGIGWLDLATTFPNLLVTQQLWIYLGAGTFDEVLVRPLMPVYTTLLIGLVFLDARRWFGLGPALLSATFLFSFNEFASLTAVVWAEIPVALYTYLAVRFVLLGGMSGGHVLLSGIFGGATILVKYTGLAAIVSLSLVLLTLAVWSRARPGSEAARIGVSLRRALGFIGVAAAVGAAPLVRNLLVLGNPIYPFVFGGLNSEPIAFFGAEYTPADILRVRMFGVVVLLGSIAAWSLLLGTLRIRSWSPPERLFILVLLLFLPMYLYVPLRGSYIRYLGPMVPLIALFAGRQLHWWLGESDRRRRGIGLVILVVLLGVTSVVMFQLDERPPYLSEFFLTFVVSVAVIAPIAAVRSLLRGVPSRSLAVLGIAAVLMAPGFLAVAGERYPPRETVWDLSILPPERETYLESRFGDDWRMWGWLNANFPRTERLLTFETRLLYLEVPVLFAGAYEMLPTYEMELQEALSYVQGLGVRYILDSPWSHTPEINRIFWIRSIIFQNLSDSSLFRTVHAEGEVIVYEIVG